MLQGGAEGKGLLHHTPFGAGDPPNVCMCRSTTHRETHCGNGVQDGADLRATRCPRPSPGPPGGLCAVVALPPIHGPHAPPAGRVGHCTPRGAQPSELPHSGTGSSTRSDLLTVLQAPASSTRSSAEWHSTKRRYTNESTSVQVQVQQMSLEASRCLRASTQVGTMTHKNHSGDCPVPCWLDGLPRLALAPP